MRFALMCKDKTGHLEVRKANREAHLTYIKETGVVEMAGPLLDADGAMVGSLIVLECDDLTAAQSWADADPYAKAGLFDQVTVSAWNKVIG